MPCLSHAACCKATSWQTQKTIHELRAWSGSQIAMRYDIYDASRWLRHSSIKVTEAHYMRYIKLVRPDDVSKMGIHWASTVAAPFIPQIIPQTTPAQVCATLSRHYIRRPAQPAISK